MGSLARFTIGFTLVRGRLTKAVLHGFNMVRGSLTKAIGLTRL